MENLQKKKEATDQANTGEVWLSPTKLPHGKEVAGADRIDVDTALRGKARGAGRTGCFPCY